MYVAVVDDYLTRFEMRRNDFKTFIIALKSLKVELIFLLLLQKKIIKTFKFRSFIYNYIDASLDG